MLLYSLLIRGYALAIHMASLRSEKARAWVLGRRDLFRRLRSWREEHPGKLLVLHAASLGEFEQGREMLHLWRKRRPEYRILVSFFSPSGFLHFRSDGIADGHTYLPADTRSNARQFVEILHPDLFVFVRYDFWFNLMDQLHAKRIPTAVVSAFFRPDMWFLKPYGKWGLERIARLDAILTQNSASSELLQQHGLKKAVFVGDGRIDRVAAIAEKSEEIPWLQAFKGERCLFIAGSPWEPDLECLLPVISAFPDVAFLIAPHDVSEPFVQKMSSALRAFSPLRFTQWSEDKSWVEQKVVILDTIGLLSRAYRHADMAFVGGGFTTGIHSIQEPAAHGCPVFFGPKHKGFPEAAELIERGGGTEVHNADDLNRAASKYLADEGVRRAAGQVCREFVRANRGASQRMVSALEELITPASQSDRA